MTKCTVMWNTELSPEFWRWGSSVDGRVHSAKGGEATGVRKHAVPFLKKSLHATQEIVQWHIATR